MISRSKSGVSNNLAS